jgi:hypothetical protein
MNVDKHGWKMPARRGFVPALLIVCLLIAGFWEVMAYLSIRPGKPLAISAKDFASFQPRSGEWSIRPCEIEPEHPSVENILVYELKRIRPVEPGPGGSSIPVLLRLVCGYNMPDCMRLRNYDVELIGEEGKGQGARGKGQEERGQRADGRGQPPSSYGASAFAKATADKTAAREARATSNIEHRTSNVEQPTTNNQHPRLPLYPGGQATSPPAPVPGRAGNVQQPTGNQEPRTRNPEPRTKNQEPGTPGLLQVWRLTSDIGDVSVGASAIIRSGDFEWTDMDVRSMPFPRIAATLDRGWEPTGFSIGGLRHPAHNFKMFLLAKWNNSRCDLLTFLRLRKGAWVSQDVLTLVSRSAGASVSRETEPEVIREVVDAQLFMYGELLRWKRQGNVNSEL